MKGFFLAAVASFIGGVLVLLFQAYVDIEGPNNVSPRVSVTSYAKPAPITVEDIGTMRVWRDSIPEYLREIKGGEIEIVQYEIKNIGRKDIESFSMELESKIEGDSDVFLYAKSSEPTPFDRDVSNISSYILNSDKKWNKLEINNKKIIEYKVPLLKKGEKFSISAAVLPNNIIFPKIRTKDVVAVENDGTGGGSDSSFWGVLGALGGFGIGLGAFFLGLGLSEYFHREVMKKIGFDYDEMIKLYKDAEKKSG